jgi:archaellin
MKYFIATILVFQSVLLFAQSEMVLSTYLRKHAVEVKESDVRGQISYFLDDRFRKQDVFWHTGVLKTTDGDYKVDALKFNTINNSVYTQYEGKTYRLNTSRVQGFEIKIDDEIRKFERGYSVAQVLIVGATYDIEHLEFYHYLSQAPEIDGLNIVETRSLVKGENRKAFVSFGQATIEDVNGIQQYLVDHQNIWGVQIEANKVQEVSDKTFFEILVVNENSKLLKHNYKKISKQESVSLVKVEQTHVFDQNTYYFSNKVNQLQEVYFTQQSIRRGMTFIGIDREKIPLVKREKKLVLFFDELD